MARGSARVKSQAQSRAQDRVLAITSGAGRTSTVPGGGTKDAADVYSELLAEATAGEAAAERPLKRRRIGESRARPVTFSDTDTSPSKAVSTRSGTEAQTITITDSENSDDDLDWEQVGLNQSAPAQSTADQDIADIAVEVGGKQTPKRHSAAKRKPATNAEKLLRLAIHKAHVLFLIFHVHVRNSWCNSVLVEATLRSLLSPRIVTFLNPRSEWPQLRRSDSFLDGLKLAVDLWRARFSVTETGMHRSRWAEDEATIKQQIQQIQDEVLSVDKDAFVKAAATLKGSQDIGNQLFCALLRAVGVEARLLCSLQTLPLSGAGPKPVTPQKSKPMIYMDADSEAGTTSAEDGSARGSASDTSANGSRIIAPRRRRRIGQPSLGMPVGIYHSTPAPAKKRKVRKLDYPVFWVEVLNPAYMKWLPIDATVTGTISKAIKLEPPASYEGNSMSYVVAFEEDGVVKDVTRRYARAYNAKTRKTRIESTEGGERWWKTALKIFKRSRILDRDQIEEAELSKKETQEGLPNSVQDFKDHPHYALERHLRRHEIIFPKREVGKINAGNRANNNLESVYRRSDVQIVRSADKWYRFGREIKASEQPLKHVPARNKRGRMDLDFDDDDEEPTSTALYSFAQTELYVPPPVVNGRIPKNGFGNLDIYVPSMIPAGGTHIKHPLAVKAARLLSIDFADAVTGFSFKGRQGTAIVSGVVVASQYREAVETVIEGFEYAQESAEEDARSLECLRLWKRFLTGLRIAQRIGLHPGASDSKDTTDQLRAEINEVEEEEEKREEESYEAGGFFPDAGADDIAAQPTAARFQARTQEVIDEDLDAPRLRRKRRVQLDSEDDDSGGEDGTYEENLPSTDRKTRSQPKRSRRKIMAEDDDNSDDIYDPSANTAGQLHDDDTSDREAEEAMRQQEEEMATAQGQTKSQLEGGVMPDEGDIETENDGAGFIPEPVDSISTIGNTQDGFNNFEDSGGGFITEHGTLPNNTNQEHASELEQGSVYADDGTGGGFMVEDEEDTMPTASVAQPAVEDDSGMVEGISDDGGAMEQQSASSADDHGSLLSHDPDDEDAEPDWLD